MAPIVDAKDFYVINEWTDAVARLVEDADPGKLGRVAQKEENTNLKEVIESKGNRFFQEIEDIIQQLAAQHFFQREE